MNIIKSEQTTIVYVLADSDEILEYKITNGVWFQRGLYDWTTNITPSRLNWLRSNVGDANKDTHSCQDRPVMKQEEKITHKPECGDYILVIDGSYPYYNTGDVGCLVDIDSDRDAYVDFNHPGQMCYDDGCWWINIEVFEIISKEKFDDIISGINNHGTKDSVVF